MRAGSQSVEGKEFILKLLRREGHVDMDCSDKIIFREELEDVQTKPRSP